MVKLTRRACADVDDVTLCPGDVFAHHLQSDGLHEHGVLGPGLQVLEADVGFAVFILRKIHVHHVPAVRAAAVLSVERGDVLERPGGDTRHGGTFKKRTLT